MSEFPRPHLVSSAVAACAPLPCMWTDLRAANGALLDDIRRHRPASVNDVVTHVAAEFVRHGTDITHVALELDPTAPNIEAEPGALAFTLAALMGLIVRRPEGAPATLLRIRTARRHRRAQVYMSTGEIPPLSLVRALLSGPAAGADPMGTRCARIIAQFHGSLALVTEGDTLGIALELPGLPDADHHAHLPPAFDHLDRATRHAAVA